MKNVKRILSLVGIAAFALLLGIGIAVNSGKMSAKAAHQHDFANGRVIPATCENVGAVQCALPGCNDIMELPPVGHDFENTEVVLNPTCDEPGFVQCSRCEVRTVLPALGHATSDWIVDREPGCEEPGHAYTVCEQCGINMYEQSIPATGHNPGNWVTEKEAACTAPGEKYRPCMNCGRKLSIEAIPSLGHELVTVTEKAATKESEGIDFVICAICGEVISSHPSPRLQ